MLPNSSSRFNRRKAGITNVCTTLGRLESPGMDIPADSALKVVEDVEAEIRSKVSKEIASSEAKKRDDTNTEHSGELLPGLPLAGFFRPEPAPEQPTIEELMQFEKNELSNKRNDEIVYYLCHWSSWRNMWCDAILKILDEDCNTPKN